MKIYVNPVRLKMRDNGRGRINGRNLLSLSTSSQRDIKYHDWDIWCDEILMLVHMCTNLSGVCLHDYNGVADRSVITLGLYCPQLCSIGFGGCGDYMTHDGLAILARDHLNLGSVFVI